MYPLYTALLAIGLLVSLPYWGFQMLRHGKYRAGLAERLGILPPRIKNPDSPPAIWIHAVSVGEVIAVSGLIEALRAKFPFHQVVVSTTTDTGQKLARTRFGEENVFYFPLDFGFAIRPYLRRFRPSMIVIAETEFWPNFLRLARRSGSLLAVVNARISDRSLPGYKRLKPMLRRVLDYIDLFLAQSAMDAQRLIDIGAPFDRVTVSGNLKFDAPPPPTTTVVGELSLAIQAAQGGPIIVCGSTMADEEGLLLSAFRNVLAAYPQAVMILAPRHPERFAEVAALLEHLGVPFWRRSQWNGGALAGGVFLLDSIGELAALYALADVAFVGGSLVPRGGHNIIEPAQHGVAIIVGNHTDNFRDIINLFRNADALRVVGPAEFPLVLLALLANPEERRALGEQAAATLQSQTGATSKTVDALEQLMRSASQDK